MFFGEGFQMKKYGKKLLLVFSVTTLMALALTGCAKKTECYICQFEQKCKEYVISGYGHSEDQWLCDDCAEDLEEEGGQFGVYIEKK